MNANYWIAACFALFSASFSSNCQAASPITAEETDGSSSIIEVTQNNFTQVVERSNQPVIIEIYANWCSSCRRMAPVFQEASSRYPDIRFAKINIDQEPDLASRYGVTHLPTILFLAPGRSKPVMKSVGFLSEDALDTKIAQFQSGI